MNKTSPGDGRGAQPELPPGRGLLSRLPRAPRAGRWRRCRVTVPCSDKDVSPRPRWLAAGTLTGLGLGSSPGLAARSRCCSVRSPARMPSLRLIPAKTARHAAREGGGAAKRFSWLPRDSFRRPHGARGARWMGGTALPSPSRRDPGGGVFFCR